MNIRWLVLLKRTFRGWMDDNAPRLSAALAYYSIFSIAPLLVITIGLLGMVFGEQAISGKLYGQLRGYVGPQSAEAIQSMVQSASKPTQGVVATSIGFILMIVGASRVFGELKDSLNTIWKVKPKPSTGIRGMVRGQFLNFGMVLVIGFLLLVSLVMSTAIAALNQRLESVLVLPSLAWAGVAFFISIGLVTTLFALIFKVLPDAAIRWRHVWFGALITALLFEVGKTGLSWYLGREGTASAFGAAGSVVLLLLWIYYTSCILLFGAVFTQVYADAAGCVTEPAEYALAVAAGKPVALGAESAVDKCDSPPTVEATEAAATPSPTHKLMAPILKYLEGRGLLLTIEAGEALQQVVILVVWLSVAVVAVFAGWLLLATALVGVLTGYLGWPWVYATAVAGAVHILVALTAGLVMWKRLSAARWFADSLNELKKDCAWLRTTKS